MSNWDTYKTTNVTYFPLVHSVPYSTNVPSWDLHQTPGNPWDDLIAAIQAWVDNVNANGKTLSGLGRIDGSSGLLGVGLAGAVRTLHVGNVPAGGGVAITGSAPQMILSNANTEPNSNTSSFFMALATAAGNYTLPNAGDSILANQGTSRGDLYISANYNTSGSKNVVLQPGSGSVGIGTGFTAPGLPLEVKGVFSVPATSGTVQAGIARFSQSTGTGVLDVGHHGTTGAWLQSVDSSNLASNFPILLNPNGGGIGIGLGTAAPSYALQIGTDSAAKPSTSTWTVASDARTKRNVADFSDGLAVVKALRPVTYEHNGLGGLPAGVTGIGLVAQDVQAHAPHMVGTFKAKLNKTDATDTDLFSLNYHSLFLMLVNACKEIEARLVALEAKK